MTGNIVSRRYAQALFSIGQEKGKKELAAYGQSLEQLAEMVRESDDFSRFFRNPVFTSEEKKAVLQEIFTKAPAPDEVKNFCFLLADKDRLPLLIEIQEHFTKLLNAAQGIISGDLTTAVTLSEALRTSIQNSLKSKIKKEVRLSFSVDKGLLGGFKLKIGDKVMDASIKTQLEILKENIKRGE